MARSRAAGSLIGRISLARPTIPRIARPLAAAPALARGRSGHAPARAGSAARLGRSARRRGAGRLLAALLRALSAHRRLRIGVLACLVSLPLLAGGWIWLRHSSFVAVQRVRVSGVHGAEAKAIETALTAAARHMSTLDVNVRALRAAVTPFPVVREVHATGNPPHGLSIHVTEQPPVAALLAGGTRTAVAADGVVLGPALLSGGLPTLAGSTAPAAGSRVADRGLLGALTVLGAAPGPFAKVVARVFTGSSGLTVTMRNGLLAYFGDASRPHAKWLSLARVLADSSSAGASYVDVRVPEHPAAGGFASGSGPAAAGASEPGAAGSGALGSGAGSEGTISAIAERLAGSKESEASEPASGGSTEAHSPAGAIEGGSGTSSETAQAPPAEPGQGTAEPSTAGH